MSTLICALCSFTPIAIHEEKDSRMLKDVLTVSHGAS
jgi:hypothetical protein